MLKRALRLSLLRRGGSAWTPAALSPDVWLEDDSAYLFQDAGKTTPAGVGDPVHVWATPGSTAGDWTAPGAGQRPTRQSDGLSADASDDRLAAATGLSIPNTSFTLYLVGTIASGSAWVTLCAAHNGYNSVQRDGDNAWRLTDVSSSLLVTGYDPAGPMIARVRQVEGGLCYVRSTGLGEVAGGSAGNWTLDTLFANLDAAIRNGSASHRLRAVLLVKRALAAGEDAQVQAYYAAKYGVSL